MAANRDTPYHDQSYPEYSDVMKCSVRPDPEECYECDCEIIRDGMDKFGHYTLVGFIPFKPEPFKFSAVPRFYDDPDL